MKGATQMKRYGALVVFWPMLAVVIVLAGVTALLRGADRLISAISDLAIPLVLTMAEVADGDESV